MGRRERIRRRALIENIPRNLGCHESYKELVCWLSCRGWSAAAPLQPSTFPLTGRGLQARGSIPAGALLVSVPVSALVTRFSVLSGPLGSVLDAKLAASLSTQAVLALWLVLERRKGDKSSWQAYLRSLPTSYSVPYFLTSEEKAALPSYINAAVSQQEAAVRIAFDQLTAAGIVQQAVPLSQSTWDKDCIVRNNLYTSKQSSALSTENLIVCYPEQPLKVCDLEQRPLKVSVPEQRPFKVCDPELRPIKVSDSELRPSTVCDLELRPSTVCEPELRPLTICEPEVRPLTECSKSAGDEQSSWLRLFEWAWFTVNTRAVYLAEDPRDERLHCRGLRLKQQKTTSAEDSLALAPYLDLLNHSASVSVRAGINIHPGNGKSEEDLFYQIITDTPVPRYAEAFISYGPHNNTKLYIEYGFTIPDNPHEYLPVQIADIRAFFLSRSSCQTIPYWVEKVSILTTESHLADNLGISWDDCLSWSLKAALTIASMNETELTNWHTVYDDEDGVENGLLADFIRFLIDQLQDKLAKMEAINLKAATTSFSIGVALVQSHVAIADKALADLTK